MLNWRELVKLSDYELARIDVAGVQLACAEGLPGAEKIDEARCFKFILECVERTRRHLPSTRAAFEKHPEHWRNSWGICQIHRMMIVLQSECRVLYNPAKISEDAEFDLEDTFLHGIVQGEGGTCASLPVLYTSVGRRLGYPLKLVETATTTRRHFFFRWDDVGGERFNIEINNVSLDCPPDDSFRTGRYALTPEIERMGCFLQSKTPKQELASFLAERGIWFQKYGGYRQAVESCAWAHILAPVNMGYLNELKRRMNDWHAAHERRMVVGFPEVWIKTQPRRFPTIIPLDMEHRILGLETVENLLNNSDLEEKCWGPMRSGQTPSHRPVKVEAVFSPSGSTLSVRVEGTHQGNRKGDCHV